MEYIIIFLISMLPIIELRGAVIYGISQNLNIIYIMIISLLGNMLIVPFVFYFARKVLEYGKNIEKCSKFFKYFLDKGHKVGEKLTNNSKYGVYVALAIFVAIPLPGSGAWTGTLAASLLDLDFKKTCIACIMGLIGAFVIMTIFSVAIF